MWISNSNPSVQDRSRFARKSEYFTNFALNENTGYSGLSQTIGESFTTI